MRKKPHSHKERMFAIAVRDGPELFLWIRIRRSGRTDIYYMIPTGRSGPEWKKWNPHGSYHGGGQVHHKSFDRKMVQAQRQQPNAGFKGQEHLVVRPISSDEPRAFGVVCNPAEFDEIMELSVSIISSDKYRTSISIDLTDANTRPNPPVLGPLIAQHAFKDAVPWIWVSVAEAPSLPGSPAQGDAEIPQPD
jgi:hypothetical protein